MQIFIIKEVSSDGEEILHGTWDHLPSLDEAASNVRISITDIQTLLEVGKVKTWRNDKYKIITRKI